MNVCDIVSPSDVCIVIVRFWLGYRFQFHRHLKVTTDPIVRRYPSGANCGRLIVPSIASVLLVVVKVILIIVTFLAEKPLFNRVRLTYLKLSVVDPNIGSSIVRSTVGSVTF